MNTRDVGESELYIEILEQLIEDEKTSPLSQALIDGALRGRSALEAVLATTDSALPHLKPQVRPPAPVAPTVFLQQVVVEGFRGAGPAATLDFVPGPGLTLVVGRNGTGKSTFAEGLETLLTGTTARWEERSQWKDTWKNLGHTGAPRVAATLLAEGIGPCVVQRVWKLGDDLAAGVFEVEHPAVPEATLDWRASCLAARPFLGYRQLGTVVDKPADVFDTLHEVLGLELLTDATSRLNEQLKAIADRNRSAATQLERARSQLAISSDERAQELLKLLGAKKPDLQQIQQSLTASHREGGRTKPALVAFARYQLPQPGDWRDASVGSTQAHEQFLDASSAAAEQSAELIRLLDMAIVTLDASGGECPVCSKPMTADEVAEIAQRRDSLKQSSKAFTTAKSNLDEAQRRMRELVQKLPDIGVDLQIELQIDPLVSESLHALKQDFTTSPVKALAALDGSQEAIESLAAAQVRAQALLAEQDEEFRGLMRPVEQWLEAAQIVDRDSTAKKALTTAKNWLARATDAKREERFEPLKQATLRNWSTLSSGSSVLLNSVKLSGRGNKRKLDLDVEVDGHGAPGVGVLSQGEINCMALSLFLPKAIHADGPFRFVMIDDPVQAMDQVKVDGLARVLHEAAQKLQVIVLTHDSRLTTSLRRLQLPCSVLEVRRSAGSVLNVRTCDPAHERYISDAWRLAKQDGLGDELPRRLVPGFCRLAVESACNQRVFKDHLLRGATFREIEDKLTEVQSLQERLAFALLGDPTRAADIPGFLKSNGGKGECNAVFQMKETHGAGSAFTRDELVTLTRRTRDLCTRVLAE